MATSAACALLFPSVGCGFGLGVQRLSALCHHDLDRSPRPRVKRASGPVNDERLLTDLRDRALKGDDVARADLLTRLRTMAHRFVQRRLEFSSADDYFAEDVASEVILQVHRSLASARATTDRELAGWVLVITRNVAVDLARRDWLRSKEADESHPVEQITNTDYVEPTLAPDALISVVFEIHDALSPEIQTILWLRLVEGASWGEIGVSLGKTMYAVRRQYQRAQERLRTTVLQRLDCLAEAERDAALRYLEALGIRSS